MTNVDRLNSYNHYTTYDIAENEEIVGVYGTIDPSYNSFTSFGFIVKLMSGETVLVSINNLFPLEFDVLIYLKIDMIIIVVEFLDK